MAQTFEPDDKVVVTTGLDAGRPATVVANYRAVYGDDLTDGALVRFNDEKPTNEPVPGQTGTSREFSSKKLRPA